MVKKDNTRIQITVSEARLSALSCFAEYLNISKSDLVNLALSEYFHSHLSEFQDSLRNSPPNTAE